MTLTAEHRPAVRRRRFAHDDLIAVDLLAGFGGLTKGIELAGFTTILAANHDRYKVLVHEKNHPHAEHWVADLINPEAADYHSARDLPAADLLVAGVTCTNHSQANTKKAYEQGLTLFDLADPDFDRRVTKSERDRATANCVLHYAQRHRPRMILIECTTELTSWGTAVPGRKKVGDGTTYRWWLKQFGLLEYDHKVLYLNSMFFGVPQSRDRLYIVFWDRRIPAPDLEHRPSSWCGGCGKTVEAVWTWKTGIPPTGSVRYGQQYNYRCPSCRREVVPSSAPSLNAIDLTDLGTRIGDRPVPPAPATLARAERCRQRFAEFPPVMLPAGTVRGGDQHPPAGQLAVAVNNYQGAPRGTHEPFPTQGGSETLGLLTAGPGPVPGLITAAGTIKNNGSISEAKYRSHPVTDPLGTVVGSAVTQSVLFSGWYKQNGSKGTETAAHPVTDSFGTFTGRDTTALLMAEWRAALADLPLEDCYLRMLRPHEIGRGCGFDVDFPGYGYQGSFIVWGTARAQVDGYGNAVSPQVGMWIGQRLRAALHSPAALV